MGVDFYACHKCGETFPDCGYHVGCECGNVWDSDECAKAEGFRKEDNGFTPKGTKWAQETSCKYCREEDFTDTELLEFILRSHNSSRNEVIKMYKEWKQNEEE
ncbi:hypothetical protein SUNDANCE_71 [Brevibacillus phage Sundance]|uniref:hypothetical protein n=1 Tax=Brevibacillus phage Sundance TaxID=1691958 RepID=UPI0006BCEF86|nr:hypothetical protein AVT09_gp071 [Brevibacillus phage Sundance]ALA47887.1 hypothetical protein SUNDANCE_71 [Brevibacillus phage Sundance]